MFCQHGHRLEIVGDLNPEERVCGRCGSVTRSRVVSESGGSQPSRDEAAASDSASPDAKHDGSMFRTVVYSDPDESSVRNPTVTFGSPQSGPPGERQSDSSTEPVQPRRIEPPNLAGYEIIDELGRGGMGVVYRARDNTTGRDVALKTLQHMSPDSLQRFKAEFRTLADIAHPNLASLYELVSDGDTWCFTMEILEAVEFLEYVWSGFDGLESSNDDTVTTDSIADGTRLTPERLERLQNAMTQLSVGLNTLHSAGVIHSDIKPSNVLMTADGRLVLLDFGLAVPLKRVKGESKVIQGTPRYMSPEQANAAALNKASDWYSVGVMLYEVLTGRAPIEGKTVEILMRKQTDNPVDPADSFPEIPAEITQLCLSLLERNPSRRPSATEVLRQFGATDVAEDLIASQSPTDSQSIELVGRELHLEFLRGAFGEVAAGNTRSIFVHGKSGMGKSVLVRSFLDGITDRSEAVILEGRCYEQESVPFKALDSLIDSLAVYLGTLAENVIHSVMLRDRLALTRVFPVLGAIPEVENATYPSIENADQQELRQRAMNALRELLQRLAIREPLVLYVDDLQWGDEDSADLLADLVRPPDAPRMLVLGSDRTENLQTSVCLRALETAYTTGQNQPHRDELVVDSLQESDAKRLALLLLDRDDNESQELAERIARESGGWPFFVWELAQHVQHDPDIGDRSLELDELIWSRVNRLPGERWQLLELNAVNARPLAAIEAYEAIHAVDKGPGFLAQLRTNSFVRMTETEEKQTIVESYHDRVRESVVEHLDAEAVKVHNLQLALTFERASDIKVEALWDHIRATKDFDEPGDPLALDKRQWQRIFDIASFFDAAGEHERAFPFALCAGEQARKQDAQEVAEQQYRIALRGADNASPALKFRVLECLGDVLVLRGNYDEGNERFEAAHALVNDEFVLARLDWKLGIAAFKKGDVGDSRDYSEKSLRALGERPPSSLTVLPRALKEAVVQVLHTMFPSKLVGQRALNTDQSKLDLFRARVYDQLTFSYWFSAGMNFVLWCHLRQMNLAERYPPSPELGKTYSFHAVTMTGIPMAERGIGYAKRAYQISVDDGDLWGQGKARCYHTFACIVLAKFHKGVETGDEAMALLEQAGDVWESNMARMIATVPRYHLGELEAAYEDSQKAYEIATECGDYSGVCIALLFWAPNSPHTLSEGAIQRELERDRFDPVTIAAAVYARGLELLLREDNPREAADTLQECLNRAKKRGVRNVCIFSAATWKATALRVLAEREANSANRTAILREAGKAALKITKSYLATRSHALREWATILAMEGREEQSRRFFDESLQVADSYSARHDHAKTSLARAEPGIKFGWSGAESEFDEAKKVLTAIEDF